VLRDAETRSGVAATALAAPAFKSGEAGLLEAAARLGLSLILLDDAQLAAVQASCPTRSIVAKRRTGLASIAEAAALAASGAGARLVLARIAHPTATCALAVTAGSTT
jgi:cobalt-precorrin 5A hydrolase